MTEEEILILNSAMVDSYLREGTKIYAVRYADPTTQIKVGTEEDLAKAEEYIKTKITDEVIAVLLNANEHEFLENSHIAPQGTFQRTYSKD